MPFDDGLDILGNIGSNKQNLELLFSCRDEIVPFIGAGLSAEFGYPSWDELIKKLADSVSQSDLSTRVRKLLAERNFEEAAAEVAEALPNGVDDALRNEFDDRKLQRPVKKGAVQHIPHITRGPILTTNFDHVLEAAFEDAGRPFRKVCCPGSRLREASRAIQLGERCLLKLHGDYDDFQSRVLTLQHYVREYGSTNPGEADLTRPLPTILGLALASRPLFFIGCSLKTDRTLAIIQRVANRLPSNVHFALLSESENTSERRKQLDAWSIRPIFFHKGNYSAIERFLAYLAKSCQTSTFSSQPPVIKPKTVRLLPPTTERINGYKLFYFRVARKLSIADLAKISKLSPNLLGRIERVRTKPGYLGPRCFQKCPQTIIFRLERLLHCSGDLRVGRTDDFLSLYIHFYHLHKGKHRAARRDTAQLEIAFETRAVVFDFDGTLTRRVGDETTWEKMWVALGYSINDCAVLHTRFLHKEFTHEEWCALTRDKFRERGFCEKQLKRIARNTHLVKGTARTIKYLRDAGVRLYIVSGSVKQIIRECLGPLFHSFDDVKANELIFDSSGVISEIRGTRYDFEGKAEYLKRIVEENECDSWDILFVGNSVNDDWASLAGVRTLCVNPRFTRPDDTAVWTYAIRKMEDLQEILKYVRI